MTRSNQNLPVEDDRYVAGDTATVELTVEKDDGSPKDLNGSDIVFAVAEYPSGNVLIKKTDDDDIDVVDAEKGRVDIRIRSSDTKSLGNPNGYQYYYEITVRDNRDKVVTVTTGVWEIYADTASFE